MKPNANQPVHRPEPRWAVVAYCTIASGVATRLCSDRSLDDRPFMEKAQATVEYVLVLLGAAAIALLLLAAIAKSDKVGQLLDAVFDSIVGKVV